MDRSPLRLSDLPDLDHLLARVLPQLRDWLPARRWYSEKGAGAPEVTLQAAAVLEVERDHLVADLVVEARTTRGATTYQVPVVLRRGEFAAQGLPEGAVLGTVAVGSQPVVVIDAPSDPDGRGALLRLLRDGHVIEGDGLEIAAQVTRPHRAAGRVLGSRLLSGEQSNTSMIFDLDDAQPVILKLFRVLHNGENPDVVVQTALDEVGSRRVPPMIGSVMLRWRESEGEPPRRSTTHALVAQGFLPGVEDAWRVALQDAAAGIDFREPARELGVALAEVHRDLASALGAVEADEGQRTVAVQRMRERLDATAAEVPEVARLREPIAQVLERAGHVAWPAVQRVHGDFHLGQVLRVPQRGWVLLDFEGEPLRPLAQRNLPDAPLRDVAGLLRSLDYVAGAVQHESGADASAWAAAAREAFLDGYLSTLPPADPEATRTLIAVFEADKAVYEALYEARNRPYWLPIPLGGLQRVLGL
ncbi:trehalose biosynthesis protein [Brachybacterium sp. EF45031]|uniref:maltokinase N-terminal cap-like domain-containing protein n=1 Tax=Brachybacterium sillae TaxID=2810536 RepID=UPI00217F1468|nr:trehalose biosynthesis protein [Brachybacterium sillae]MCS6712122.1 trehalose biosynthesis protein [Brachybacterium sillae]